jgi:hypothetical protein
MNNITNTESGERLSFYKLFKDENYRIVIPIIQRDYAQGRKSEKEVRDTFLDALFNYLDDNKPNRDLDFIYGTLKEDEGIINFIPLDGQQRLTTLFLLHWYLYQISGNEEIKEKFITSLLRNGKSMFTYETRSSSSDFCDALMGANLNFNKLLAPDKDENNSLSKTIKNCPWYYLTWEYDPTIQAMLTMLDAIHEKFPNKKEFFARLLDTDKPIITFLFLNLKEYNLTDDLYIKMNSRGKPLTPFENFKAKFEQYLASINTKITFKLIFKDNGNEVEKNASLKKYFSHNIDTKWTNLFWQYRKLQNRSNSQTDNTFDDELMNFIRVIFTNQYAVTLDLSSKEKDDTLEYLLGTQIAKNRTDYSEVISFNKYQKLGVLSTDSIFTLIDIFDELTNGNNEIKKYLSNDFEFYYYENATFKNALKLNFQSYHERLMFFAYVSFLLENKDNRNGINQWMRVIHNLTHPDNTIIDSATDFSRAIKSIEKFLPESNNILEFLKENPTIDFFSSWQILEEKIKAHLILKDDEWKEQVIKTEQHKYFNGQIGFILEFAGIIDFYMQNKHCNWNAEDNKKYFDKLFNYADIAFEVFAESYENRINDEDFIFERTVLTKGDYLTEASQNRYNLLSTSQVKNNIKRDHSWKRLLRISDKEWLITTKEEYDDVWVNRRSYVKQVFDDLFNKKTLEQICKTSTNDWRNYFIKCPSLISYCKQGFIRFENEHNILLYGQSQSNHMHVEMYTYYLWKKYIEPNKESYLPFENIYYYEVKSIDDYARIVFDKFIFNRINYEINIFYNDNDEFPNPYEIKFLKSKGDNLPEKYGDSVKQVLERCGYKWNDDNEGYFYTCKDINELIEKLNETTEQLKNN